MSKIETLGVESYWGEYAAEIAAVLARPVSRPPTLGIAVRTDGNSADACH